MWDPENSANLSLDLHDDLCQHYMEIQHNPTPDIVYRTFLKTENGDILYSIRDDRGNKHTVEISNTRNGTYTHMWTINGTKHRLIAPAVIIKRADGTRINEFWENGICSRIELLPR